MIMKVCFKCGIEKPINEFYTHKKMGDGHLNKCKDCTKKDTKDRLSILSTNDDWFIKERIRHREKYHRLGYKEKQKEWDRNKPWKKEAIYKGLRHKYNLPKSVELHHWNYNKEYMEDVFILDKREHKKAHRLIKIDIDKRIYETLNGVLLDTKQKHYNYLFENGIKI